VNPCVRERVVALDRDGLVVIIAGGASGLRRCLTSGSVVSSSPSELAGEATVGDLQHRAREGGKAANAGARQRDLGQEAHRYTAWSITTIRRPSGNRPLG
jgi:hypothetical protein